MCYDSKWVFGEICDDGGASEGCLNCLVIAPGWSCFGGTDTSPDECLNECGSAGGTVHPPEECDDFND